MKIIASVSDAVFLAVFISAIALNIAAWWRFRKTKSSFTPEQKKKTLAGLLSNLVAFSFPFVYAFSSIFTVSLQRAVEWQYVLLGCWVLCALTLVLSALGPRQVRFLLLLGSLAIGVFWTMVPLGVL